VGHVHRHGDAAQGAKDAARPQRIADALVHAVAQRDGVIVLKAFEPADLEGGNDIIGPPQGLAAVGGDVHLGRQPVGVDDPPGKGLHLGRAGGAGSHEGELGALQARRG